MSQNFQYRYLLPVAAMSALLMSCGASEVQIGDGTTSSGVADTNTDGTGTDGTDTDSTDGTQNGSGGSAGGAIMNVGLLKIEPFTAESDFTRALFGRLDSPLTVQDVQRFYVPGEDTCLVSPLVRDEADTDPVLTVLDQTPTLTSAGETIIVSSNQGTYATLVRETGESGFYYKPEVALTTAAPAGLVVDVVGDEFPAFSQNIQDVPSLQVTSPTPDDVVNGDTVFEWNANNAPGSVFEITVAGEDDDGQEIVIGCTVVDDGSFTFPESVRIQMGVDFRAIWKSYLRIGYTVSQQGDAMFFTANSVANQ